MTGWFGESWGAPVNDGPHVPTPVGSFCLDCGVKIEHGDRGLMIPHLGDPPTEQPHHLHCFLGAVGIPKTMNARAPQRPLTRGLALDLREQCWSIEQIAEEYGRDPSEVRALLSA
jgi:hypothetical protein